jgi:hypothetical protein
VLRLFGALALAHGMPPNEEQAVLPHSLHRDKEQAALPRLSADEVSNQCKSYLLFSSQRSGSTWTCQVLDAQLGISCGRTPPEGQEPDHGTEKQAELMIQFSPSILIRDQGMIHSEVTWAQWSTALKAAFATVRKEFCPPGSHRRTVGFKLMYDQVPYQLVPQFLSFLESNEVTVLHLVREAAVLRLASDIQSRGLQHSSDANELASHAAAPWQWDTKTGENIRALEWLNAAWSNLLRFSPDIRYHYVAYEQLIGPKRDNYFRELIRVTGGPGLPGSSSPFADVPGELLMLHEPTCEERVEQYAQLATELGGTRTRMACAMLAASPERNLPKDFAKVSPFWGVGSGCREGPCQVPEK